MNYIKKNSDRQRAAISSKNCIYINFGRARRWSVGVPISLTYSKTKKEFKLN